MIAISIEDLQVGMYVTSIDLSWMNHPFWRRRFPILTQSDIDKLRDAGVRNVVIDDDKGLGLPQKSNDAFPEIQSTIQRKIQPVRSQSPPPEGKPQRLSGNARAVEIRRASKILNRSKKAVMNMFADARMGKMIKTQGVGNLVTQISESVGKDPSIILNIAKLKSKDEYTYLHSVSVCALMINFARKLKLDESVVHEMGLAGMLHDVGKMAIPDEILNKPGRLNDDEFDIVRNHPERGFAILSGSKSVSPVALDVCLSHHEKMDGTGYPNKTRGDNLSLASRMAAICDVYDAVTSQRSYNSPWTASEALQRMLGWKGHFDQLLLKTFIESLGIWPVGTAVLLSDKNVAIITGEHRDDFSLPRTRIFYSTQTGSFVTPYDVQILNDGQSPTIVAELDPADIGIENWSQLSAQLLDEIEAAVA